MGARQQITYWLLASRLHTLPLAVATVGLGSALAYGDDAVYSTHIFTWMLLTFLGGQVVANLANDLGDGLHGIDHPGRHGPTRMLQAGHLSAARLKKSVIWVSIATFICGLITLSIAFTPFSLPFFIFTGIGILSIWLAIRYTCGRRPYGHVGGGDLAVWICFGPIGVVSTYFLHTQTWITGTLLPAAGLGAYAVAILNINNLRDIHADQIANKRSIALRLGRKNAVHYHRLLLLVGSMCFIIYGYFYLRGWSWLFLSTYPAFVWIACSVQAKSTTQALNNRLKQLVICTLLHVTIFALGLWLEKAHGHA